MPRKASAKTEDKKTTAKKTRSAKAGTSEAKTSDEENSVIVQIDEETEIMLKMISDSIRESIKTGIKELLPSQEQNGTADDDTSYEIGKLKNRLDNIEEKIDDITESIKQTNQKLDKIMMLLNSK